MESILKRGTSQKEAATGCLFCKKRCYSKFCKNPRKTAVPESLSCRNFIKKETLALVLSCKFCEISKNIFSTEQLQTTAYGQNKLGPPETIQSKVELLGTRWIQQQTDTKKQKIHSRDCACNTFAQYLQQLLSQRAPSFHLFRWNHLNGIEPVTS